MTPRRPEALLFALLLLISIPGPIRSQKQFIKDVRHKRFFLITNLTGTDFSPNGSLYKDGKKIGVYHMLMNQDSQILCQVNSDQPLLDENCYILDIPKPDSQKIIPEKKTRISSMQVDRFLFVRKGKIFITTEPISLNQIGNVENLPGFLETIEKKIQSKYRANIPRGKEIKQNQSHFFDSMVGRFIICNIRNRLGYAYIEEDEIVTKPVLKETINKLKHKFYFYIVLK